MKKSIKNKAVDFLLLSASGKSREAFKLYASDTFKHHNIHFKGDGNTLMIAMEENAKKFPEKSVQIHHVLQDGEFVAIHSHVKPTPADPGFALMHIFHFIDDQIVELWDFGQAVPYECINENGMF
jgi:predicted SnoaL-like aldol condensation-catalyzing enzyme